MTGLAALWAESAATAAAECAARRERVLRHEDLAKRLVAELGFERAGQWNGFIPPRMVNLGLEETCHNSAAVSAKGLRSAGAQVNESPRRAALVTIAAEAMRRERELPATTTEETPWPVPAQ